MKIGLALSGGGFRASVFHLGVLGRLAAGDMLEDVTALSTVSGGSLCVGLIYAANGSRWPDSRAFREDIVPHARHLFTTTDLQRSYIEGILRAPLSAFRGRAVDVAALLWRQWGVTANLRDLPAAPQWFINATSYETGKNWRFTPQRMGDYLAGYVEAPDFPLAEALAASAAVPGIIGPLVVDATQYAWTQYRDGAYRPARPTFARYHLWDGAVYENLGVETLFHPSGRYRAGIDFLLTSDASARPGVHPYRFLTAPYRLIGLATDQVRLLRARAVVNHLVAGGHGSYLQIDNDCAYLLERAGRADEIPGVRGDYLPADVVAWAAGMESTIRRLTMDEFERLFRHGYEVADVTMYAFASGGQERLLRYDRAMWH